MAAKPPTTAAKLIPLIAPAAVEAVAGLELVAELLDPVLLAEAAGVAVPEAVLVGTKLLTATDGMVTFWYAAQVALMERGQSAATQMLWS